MTLFVVAALNPLNQRVHGFDCEEERLQFHNMVRKPASVTQISRSGMFQGENFVKQLWWHEEMPSENFGDVYFTQKVAELMGVGYAIFGCFADGQLSKMLSESAGLPRCTRGRRYMGLCHGCL